MLIPVWNLERRDWLTASVAGNNMRLDEINVEAEAQYRLKLGNILFSKELKCFPSSCCVKEYVRGFDSQSPIVPCFASVFARQGSLRRSDASIRASRSEEFLLNALISFQAACKSAP